MYFDLARQADRYEGPAPRAPRGISDQKKRGTADVD